MKASPCGHFDADPNLTRPTPDASPERSRKVTFTIVALSGSVSSGKSTLAERLSDRYGAYFLWTRELLAAQVQAVGYGLAMERLRCRSTENGSTQRPTDDGWSTVSRPRSRVWVGAGWSSSMPSDSCSA